MKLNSAAMKEESGLGSSRKPNSAGGSGEVAAAKSKLDDPGFRPVVRLVNLLGGLQERDPESFRKVMEALRAGLTKRSGVELRDGRRFAIVGPLAILDSAVDNGKQSRLRVGAATRHQGRN